MGSIWSGDAENAYFSSDTFDKHRILKQPEYEYSGRSSKNAYYILSMDVGRSPNGCTSEICVIKVTPQPQGPAIQSLVNIYSLEAEHFGHQAIFLKKLFYKYKARTAVIDANGIGYGFIDFLVVSQVDEDGNYYPPFGVEDGSYENAAQEWKKYKTDDTEKDALYLMKANAPINSEAHAIVHTQLGSGKLQLLIDEQEAKIKLMETKVGQNMTPEQRNEYLMPFQQTSILKEQMLRILAA